MPLKKKGKNYWGLCPFHGEKTASFSVDPDKQMYYCFGCKAAGTVFQFVQEMEHMTYHEAVAFVADRCHVPLPEMESDAEWQRRQTLRDRLLAANVEAARFYHANLFTASGAASLAYLKKRGLSDGVIRKFGLGAASDSWDEITKYLQEKGFTLEELHLAGLTVIKEAEAGKPRRAFDMFRSRAMFPIIDQKGNVLAFGGRSLDGSEPKYLNTSDTPVYNKRKCVYALNLLHKLRHLNRVVLVEGYMDVVSLTQFGVPGVVATLGTALTPEQARLLQRYAPVVHLGYDGDSAGQHAILKGLDILSQAGVPAKVLDFPDKLDPDEFIRRDGLEGFAALAAITPETYRMRRLKEQYDMSTEEGRANYAKACAPVLRPCDPVDLEVYLRQLSLETGFSREVLVAQIGLTPATAGNAGHPGVGQTNAGAWRKTGAAPEDLTPPRSEAIDENTRAQEHLLSILATGRLPEDLVTEEDFTDVYLKDLFLRLKAGDTLQAILDAEADDVARGRVARLFLEPSYEGQDQLLQMAHECLSRCRLLRLQEQEKTIRDQLTTATGEEKTRLINEYSACRQKINEVKSKHSIPFSPR